MERPARRRTARRFCAVAGGSGTGETIVAATSVTYALQDPTTIPSFSLYSFRTPATETQRIALGSVVAEATFQFGQNIACHTRSIPVGERDFRIWGTTERAGAAAMLVRCSADLPDLDGLISP